MNKIVHTIIGVTLVGLMAGCASAPANVAPTVSQVAPVELNAPAEPLKVDETPAPTSAPGDEVFLTETRIRIQGIKSATDEQLITAGHTACDLYSQGQNKMDMRLIEGETANADTGWYMDSLAIATWAAKAYCPAFDEG